MLFGWYGYTKLKRISNDVTVFCYLNAEPIRFNSGTTQDQILETFRNINNQDLELFSNLSDVFNMSPVEHLKNVTFCEDCKISEIRFCKLFKVDVGLHIEME